jgi:hypothetical protein
VKVKGFIEGRASRHEERDDPFRETYNSGEKRWMKFAAL